MKKRGFVLMTFSSPTQGLVIKKIIPKFFVFFPSLSPTVDWKRNTQLSKLKINFFFLKIVIKK